MKKKLHSTHRVDRVLGFFFQSSELGLPHSLAGEGVGGPNSDEDLAADVYLSEAPFPLIGFCLGW